MHKVWPTTIELMAMPKYSAAFCAPAEGGVGEATGARVRTWDAAGRFLGAPSRARVLSALHAVGPEGAVDALRSL